MNNSTHLPKPSPITVLGGGSWGTALAIHLARNHPMIRLWIRDQQQAMEMQQHRCNIRYLPHVCFPDNLAITHDLNDALSQAHDIIIAVPSHAFSLILGKIHTIKRTPFRLAWATKGLDPDSGHLLSEVAETICGKATSLAVISGPSFASELAKGLPTAISISGHDKGFLCDLSTYFHNAILRVYTNHDMIGAQLGGAVKNVLAIAVGIADGLGFGANTRAALITRGMAEMMRLGIAMGGKQETFMGLSGLGDAVLSCTDNQSRNRRFGLGLGEGKKSDVIKTEIGQVVEGASTVVQVYHLARRYNIDMPITEQVYRVLYEHVSPRDAVQNLLSRGPKHE